MAVREPIPDHRLQKPTLGCNLVICNLVICNLGIHLNIKLFYACSCKPMKKLKYVYNILYNDNIHNLLQGIIFDGLHAVMV